MKSFAWILSGLVAGAVGAAVWAAIVYYTGWEIGWIAWGMGVLVGVTVAAGAKEETGLATGVGAACIAAASVLGGKYAVVQMVFDDVWEQTAGGQVAEATRVDDNMLIAALASQLIQQQEDAGETVVRPVYDEDDPDLTLEQTFPPEVWEDAKTRWESADDSYKTEHRAFVESRVADFVANKKSEMVQQGFLEVLSLWDLLWLGLAVFSAWRIGSGGGGD